MYLTENFPARSGAQTGDGVRHWRQGQRPRGRNMDIGIFSGAAGKQFGPAEVVDDVRAVHAAGIASYWLPQMPSGPDPLVSLAIAGAAVPDIELGVAVLNVYARHPLSTAQQALTISKALGEGRFALGIGLSHQPVIEGQFGIPFERPVRYMREYLEILQPQLRNEPVQFCGDFLTGRAGPMYEGAPPPSVLLAALGPQMLRLAGRMADGTVVYMTGDETLRNLTVPTMHGAAEAAGRPEPRVGVGVPICCTDDVDGARELAATLFQVYGVLPSYRAMLDREGLAGPEDIAIIGNEDHVSARLAATFAAGATTVVGVEFGQNDDDLARTRACLAALSG